MAESVIAPTVTHAPSACGEFAQKEDAMGTYLRYGCTIVAFLVPLKLSWTYVVLIPLLIAWFVQAMRTKLAFGRLFDLAPPLVPFAYFCVAITVGSISGLNLWHSAGPLVSFLFYAVTLLAFFQYGSISTVLPALVAGQSIAGLHSVLDSAYPNTIRSLFIGKVTESGQLALTLLVALGLAWTAAERLPAREHARKARLVWLGLLSATLVCAAGFRVDLHLDIATSMAIWSAGLLVVATSIFLARKHDRQWQHYVTLVALQIPLLIGALLVNLKRGPWFGIIVGSVVFFTVFAPRVSRWLAGCALLLIIALEPVRDRLASSYDHFVISGGRSTIWRIGAELSAKYPLGIGFHNGEILRRFAPEIPPELRHFHNNLLNITVENGWIAAGLFAWFIIAILRYSFRRPIEPLYAALGCAIISWQAAGLVEYNVGDSEVMLIVWIIVGVLCGAVIKAKEHSILTAGTLMRNGAR